MSQRAGKFSWEQHVVESGLPSTTRLLLLAISVRMNKLGEGCFPSTEQLAEMTGLSKKAVITHRQKAVDAGWLQVAEMGFRGRKWRRMSYVAAIPGTTTCGRLLDDGETEEGVENAHEVVNEVHHPNEQGGERGTPKVVNEVHHVYEQTTNQTTLERERADARTPEGGKGDQPDGSTSGGTTSGLPFASFKRKWPNRAVDDMGKAQVEFDKLNGAEKQAAIDGIVPYREALKAAGRTKLHAAANYLKQRKWEDVDAVPDPSAPYLPPPVPAFGALWSAAMIEMLRTGAFARKRYVFKQLCEGAPNKTLAFGKERDGELVSAAQRFTKAQASSEAGRAFLAWLEAQFASARMPHQMPRFRDDFWLYVPPPDIAKAWGLELDVPNHETPMERSGASPERHGPLNDDEVADAFAP